MNRKLSLISILILAFCILAITATIFPNHAATLYEHLGAWGDTLENICGEATIVQPVSLPVPARLLTFSLTSFNKEISQGNMDVCLKNADTGEVVYSQQFTMKHASDNQQFNLFLNTDSGDYVLELHLNDFDPQIPVTFYSALPNERLASAYINGIDCGRALYLDGTTRSQIAAIPLLAVAFLLLALVLPLFLHNRQLFRQQLIVTCLCSLTDVAGWILPIPNVFLHYPLILLQIILLAPLIWNALQLLGWNRACIMDWSRKNRPVIFTVILAFAASLLLAAGVEASRSVLLKDAFLIPKWFFFSALIFCVLIHLIYRKKLIRNLPVSFLIVVLCAGTCMSLCLPAATLVCWDDETHYGRTLFLSDGPRIHISSADRAMTLIDVDKTFSVSEARDNREMLNLQSENYIRQSYRSAWLPGQIGYLPHVIGLWMGRILGLDFVGTFLLGRISNLLFYAVVVYFAMKQLKSGQLLLYVVAMLPTNIFQAGNYSYDIWVTGLLMLGFSFFIGALQRSDDPLSSREIWIMLTALVVGCFPKAIYAACIPILLLLPKSKLSSDKAYRKYWIMVIIAAIVALISYFIPFVLQGAFSAASDSRGGSDVSSPDQVRFILTQPLAYTKILLTFLAGYLNPINSYGYTCSMAYLGGKDMHILATILLFAVAIADHGACDRIYKTPLVKIVSAFFLFGAVCLAATALYVAFTPVGYETINGCQPRYLLPLLFPALALIGNVYTNRNTDVAALRTAAVILSGYIIWYDIWFTTVSPYIP